MVKSASGMSWRPRQGRSPAATLRAGIWLVLVCAAVYLPGLWSWPTIDRDEARFAQASRQMFESTALPLERRDLRVSPDGSPLGAHSGGWAVPMLQNAPRLNKPPLIYWLQAGSAWLCTGGDPGRDAIWMYRLPSTIAAFATVLLTWGWGRRMFSPYVAWAGAALLCVMPTMFWESHQARADMVLLAITTAAAWALWEVWRARARTPWGRWAILWSLVGLGVMVKGPATPLIIVGAILARCLVARNWSFLWRSGLPVGLVIVAIIVLPWFALVVRHVGWDSYLAILHREVIDRSLSPQEGHSGPPGYHLALACLTLWPGVLFAGPALARAVREGLSWRASPGLGLFASIRTALQTLRPGRPNVFMLLCLIVPAWYAFELASTKLPHYTMPLAPAIALLLARPLVAWHRRPMPEWRRPLAIASFLWGGIVLVMIVGATLAGVFAASGFDGPMPGRSVSTSLATAIASGHGILGTGAALGAGVAITIYYIGRALGFAAAGRFDRLARLGAISGALAMITAGLCLGYVAPVWVAHRALIAARFIDAKLPVAMVKLHEDSTIFESRGRVDWVDEHELKAWLWDHPGGIVVLPPGTAQRWPAFRTEAIVWGFNYSKGVGGSWEVGTMSRDIAPAFDWVPGALRAREAGAR